MCIALIYAEMRVRCCQKQDFRDGEDFQDGLVCGWRLLSESGFGGFSGSGQSNGPGWVVGAFDYRATCGIFPRRWVRGLRPSRESCRHCADSVKVFYLHWGDLVGKVETEDAGVEVQLSFQ